MSMLKTLVRRAIWIFAAVALLTNGAPADDVRQAAPGKSDAAQPEASLPGQVRLAHCLVSLIDEVDVPAQEAGQLVLVEAEEGQAVDEGSLLAQIDDQQPRDQLEIASLEREAAEAQAKSDVAIRHAKSSAEVAKAEYDTITELNATARDAVPKAEQRRKQLEWKTRVLQIEQATLERQVAALTARSKDAVVRAADSSIRRRRIVSPLPGLVVEVHRSAGEWVQPGDRVIRIVRMDRLRVEGFVKADALRPSEVDHRPVDVEVTLARGLKKRFPGKITFVDPRIEVDGEYRVWAEVVNEPDGRLWHLRPGMKVEMVVDLTAPAVSLEDDAAAEAADTTRVDAR